MVAASDTPLLLHVALNVDKTSRIEMRTHGSNVLL